MDSVFFPIIYVFDGIKSNFGDKLSNFGICMFIRYFAVKIFKTVIIEGVGRNWTKNWREPGLKYPSGQK